jgi:pimeloyl-ACP methyl ester carboxylesterase
MRHRTKFAEAPVALPRVGRARIGGVAATAICGAALAAANHLLAKRAEARHPPRGRFLIVDGVRLHYLDAGEGPPIVLLHGNAVTSEDFVVSGLVSALSRSHRVLAFDRPGYGYSERPRGRNWSASAQAELFWCALAQLSINAPVAVGHSWGALVATEMALSSPHRIGGVVLMSGYYRPTPRLDALAAGGPAIPVIGDVVRHTVSPVLARLMAPLILKQVFAPAQVPPRFRDHFPLSLSFRPSQLQASSAEAARMEPCVYALRKKITGMPAPMLLIAGRQDRLISTSYQTEWLAKTLPEARCVIVNNAGHMVHHTAVDQVAAAILQFSFAAV